MLQIRGGLDLAQEALGADYRREFGAQDLDGDVAVVLEVMREMYRRHPACTELAVETVPVGERQSESFDQGSQGGER